MRLIAARLEGLDGKALRDAVDMLKDKLGDAVIVLASAEDGKASLVAGVKGSALGRVKAGELLSHVAGQIGGKGGGRPDMAQGGGQDGPALVAALAGVQRLGGAAPGLIDQCLLVPSLTLRREPSRSTIGCSCVSAAWSRGSNRPRTGARKYRKESPC